NPSTGGRSPSASNRSPGTLSRSSRDPFTRRCTALSSKPGSSLNGGPLRQAGWQSSTRLRRPVGVNSRRNWLVGLVCRQPSMASARRLDVRALDKVRLRLRSLIRRRQVERELDRELRFHVDQLVEDNLAAGMMPDEARQLASLQMGGVTQFQEECRDM